MSTLEPVPPNYASDPTVAHIMEQLRSDDPSPILVSGEAGTGKSTLVNFIKNQSGIKNIAILAPTGVAALNVGGQTIHSFFRLPFKIIDEHALADQRKNRLWKKVKLVVIDEISMVRADMLDGIDIILRKAQDSRQPFGGSRRSGTNDKAGSPYNLMRWASPRTIKEQFLPPTDHGYSHMKD